jgi:hypothetical protein
MRMKVICVAIFFLVNVVSSGAQSASAMRAICLEQVGKIDHSVFPLAISDSEDGAKWCLDELGMPKEVLSAQVVAPPTMTDFLVELRTVTGTKEKVPAASSMSFKFIVLQAEGRREMTLDRPTTHKLVKRLLQHCRGTRLHEFLAYVETQTGRPRQD